MFKQIKTIDSIRTFSIFKEALLKVNVSFELFKDENLISRNVHDTGYIFFKSKIIYLSETNTWIDKDKYENLSFLKGSEDANSNNVILSGDFKLAYPNFSNNYYLYDLASEELKFLVEFKNLFFFFRYGSTIVFSDKNNLHAYTLPTAKPLWQFDLKEIGDYATHQGERKTYEVRKFLGVWSTYLLVALSNDELLIIDINTGNFVKKLSKIPPQIMAEYTVDYLGNCMELDEQEGKVKGFVNFVFWELDLSTFTFGCYNLAATLTQNKLNTLMNTTSYAQSNEHYFVTMYSIDENGSMWTYLVALNKTTKLIDWKQEIPWSGNNVPQYANEKLYILDTNNTLHIFQKES